MNINQDNYFNEDSLYSDGKIENIINEFKNKGLAYEKDDALWLKLSEMGLQDDRVIVKSTGEPTYRLPDMAYHREKFERGFDRNSRSFRLGSYRNNTGCSNRCEITGI